MNTTKKGGELIVPVAIVIAAIIIALAVIFTNKGVVNAPKVDQNNNQQANTEIKLEPVTSADHIRGDINAPIKIVEFSDIECPYCKRFHETLKEVTAEYGDKVVWIYRQAPIVQLHPKAFNEANATECVAELGGNDKFWEFLDIMYSRTPSNNQFDLANLPIYAAEIGINTDAFNTCQTAMKYKDKIDSSVQQAAAAGGQGTPHTIVIGPDGSMTPILGAQPIEVVKQTIDGLLSKK
jgi:protein-disulfide isomerase